MLLRQISGVESRVPWTALGIALLCLLWLPGLARLGSEPVRPAETAWVQEALTPWEAKSDVSAFSRQLTLATWAWQGAEIESATLTPTQRLATRLPSLAAGLAALLVFYLLARLIVGDAAALLAASLLAVTAPWVQAGSSALPLMLGEMLVLMGVVWALSLQSRHREVELAGVNAIRIGVAGVFLGLGLLMTPAGIATFATTLLVWLLLGIRRSDSNATTLPVGRPAATAALAFLGAGGLLVGATVSMWAAEFYLGGAPLGLFHLLPTSSSPELWADVYRKLLSPGPMGDLLMGTAVLVVAVVRAIEWAAGRPWRAAGLLPWLFVGLWIFAVRSDQLTTGTLDVPMTVPPLFVLGAGWLVLRGLRPGVVRRQEYTFLLIWVLMGTLLIPVVGGARPHAALLAACLVLLPALVLVAARGARALWETEDGVLARAGILVIAYAPVLVFLLHAIDHILAAGVPGVGAAANALDGTMPWIVLGAALLGIVSVFTTVRPDKVVVRRGTRRRGEASGRRPHRRRGGRDRESRSDRGGRGSSGRSRTSGTRPAKTRPAPGTGDSAGESGRSGGKRSGGGKRRSGRRRGRRGGGGSSRGGGQDSSGA